DSILSRLGAVGNHRESLIPIEVRSLESQSFGKAASRLPDEAKERSNARLGTHQEVIQLFLRCPALHPNLFLELTYPSDRTALDDVPRNEEVHQVLQMSEIPVQCGV